MENSKPFVYHGLGLLISLLYGVLCVYIFQDAYFDLETFSWSFVMILPYSLGATIIWYYTRHQDKSALFAVIMPILACVVLYGVVLVFSAGLLLCFIAAVPLIFPPASLGGLSMWLLRKNRPKMTALLAFALFAPFVGGSVEANIENERILSTTHTSIIVEASAQEVWDNITIVPEITAAEHHFNWLHAIGLPRPIEATMSEDGVGAVRQGTFSNGVRFDETVTEWIPNERFGFVIVETSEQELPPPLNLIDSEYFDVIDGFYEIEQLDDGKILLHLSSDHFVSTPFSEYGAFWTDLIMRELQTYILEIVKARVEA